LWQSGSFSEKNLERPEIGLNDQAEANLTGQIGLELAEQFLHCFVN